MLGGSQATRRLRHTVARPSTSLVCHPAPRLRSRSPIFAPPVMVTTRWTSPWALLPPLLRRRRARLPSSGHGPRKSGKSRLGCNLVGHPGDARLFTFFCPSCLVAFYPFPSPSMSSAGACQPLFLWKLVFYSVLSFQSQEIIHSKTTL
jgi:hypothetical protein